MGIVFQNETKQYNGLKYRMAIGFSLVFILTITIVSVAILYQTNGILTGKVLELTDDVTRQIVSSLDSVIYSHENMTNVLFLKSSEEETGTPDQSVVFMSRLRALQNYGKLAVCYKDGTVLGNLAQESMEAIGEPLYSVLDTTLRFHDKERMWFAADTLSCGQVFFTRRSTDSFIMVSGISVYEIASRIGFPNPKNGLHIRVVTPNGIVVYSSDYDENGLAVDIGEIGLLYTRLNKPQVVNRQISVVRQCSNGWLITATADFSDILKERYGIVQFAVVVLFLAFSAIILFCIIFSMRLTLPVTTLVRRLYNQSIKDPETGLFLKEHFGFCVKKAIDEHEDDKFALIQLDIDNFKQMHDMRGNYFCDRIIRELADSMLISFPEDAIFGRIGHDRFMVFSRLPGDSFQTIHQWCLTVQDSFRDRVEKTENATGVSVSAGIVLIPEHGTDFDMLCELTDRAVFTIKKQGKNGYHIYTPEDDVDLWR